jgi:predicted oxidoreductase
LKKYVWSEDNSAEIEKGWIANAATLEELADQMKRPPEDVIRAIDTFNADCARGTADKFGRQSADMQPIDTPPYYAVEIVPGIVCTTGGGKRNEHSQVLDASSKPIPRLYEAGELGSTMANLYQNGSFLTECMVFGRIAARHALALDVWDT